METSTLTTRKKISIAIACALVLLGLFIPLWYVAIAGLILLCATVPFAGIGVGFLLDIIYGVPPLLPLWLSFPWLALASVIGVLSLLIRTYIR